MDGTEPCLNRRTSLKTRGSCIKNPKKVAPGLKVALRLRSEIWSKDARSWVDWRREIKVPKNSIKDLGRPKTGRYFCPRFCIPEAFLWLLESKTSAAANYDDGPLTTKPHFWYEHFMSTDNCLVKKYQPFCCCWVQKLQCNSCISNWLQNLIMMFLVK